MNLISQSFSIYALLWNDVLFQYGWFLSVELGFWLNLWHLYYHTLYVSYPIEVQKSSNCCFNHNICAQQLPTTIYSAFVIERDNTSLFLIMPRYQAVLKNVTSTTFIFFIQTYNLQNHSLRN